MADDTDALDSESSLDNEGAVGSDDPTGVEEDTPSYRSGRVRIIGAEPAGNAVHEVTGPVVEENPDMPHWNDAPTGQVPAVLDRGNGEEQALAPPTWREEDTDWAAHEELFEPSMLSDELPAVGSMMNNNNDLVDMERQPWRFDAIDDLPDDDTLVIVEVESEAEAEVESGPDTASPADVEPEPESVPLRVAPAALYGATVTDSPEETASVPSSFDAADARLTPPVPPQPRVRARARAA